VIVLLAIALAFIAESLALRMRLVRQESRTITLVALSDAAVAEAVGDLARIPSFRGAPEHPFGGGSLASQISTLAAGRYLVRATATLGGERRVVEAEIESDTLGMRVVRWRRVAQ
nr:hypothetical protein [Acidobacteriota bacterium]